MRTLTAITVVTLLALIACDKDREIPPKPTESTPTPTPNYAPLTTGSYWIYDWYAVDTLGNTTATNITDSVYIAGDTIIGTNTYAIKEGTYFGGSVTRQFLRDSSGYLVNNTGRIFFSSTNYTDTLHIWNSMNGETTGFLKMTDIGEIVTVPAGTFTTLNAEFVVVNNVGTWPCVGTLDIHDNQYSENVGKVRATIQSVSSTPCTILEQRLVSYQIN